MHHFKIAALSQLQFSISPHKGWRLGILGAVVARVRQHSASETASLTNQTPGASAAPGNRNRNLSGTVCCAALCCAVLSHLLRRRVPRSTYRSYAFQSQYLKYIYLCSRAGLLSCLACLLALLSSILGLVTRASRACSCLYLLTCCEQHTFSGLHTYFEICLHTTNRDVLDPE
jgi:hypothetical protein